MKVKEVAELTGISVRTLHHYNEIGLLIPDKVTAAGYRIYSDKNLETLQQILFFREFDFPLGKIKEILGSPAFNQVDALLLQRKMLVEKRSRMDQMIAMIDKTIEYKKGGTTMSNKEKFEGFDFSSNPYEQEARDRWGDQAVDEANTNMFKMSKEKQKTMEEEWNRIYKKLADLRHGSPETREAQEAIKAWYQYLNKIGKYSPEAFKGLGQMYVSDERFTKNIDKYGKGLPAFMCEAMGYFADNLKK